eukprot:TRINITY_DN289_c0_g1_i1.p1 TRINITY_DN289_c0_g1~~TRINITY_DN289_c0_g1_i1.p1  ORF type:complete len:191 (+),score=8.37 TRINITY_DN289_c0_g1_i1:175-747(+)
MGTHTIVVAEGGQNMSIAYAIVRSMAACLGWDGRCKRNPVTSRKLRTPNVTYLLWSPPCSYHWNCLNLWVTKQLPCCALGRGAAARRSGDTSSCGSAHTALVSSLLLSTAMPLAPAVQPQSLARIVVDGTALVDVTLAEHHPLKLGVGCSRHALIPQGRQHSTSFTLPAEVVLHAVWICPLDRWRAVSMM